MPVLVEVGSYDGAGAPEGDHDMIMDGNIEQPRGIDEVSRGDTVGIASCGIA